MFQNLSDRLQDVFKKLKGKGKLTESDIKEAMREVRIALLEADVNFQVVKDFINKVREKSVGQEILQSLTPGQQVIKIVRDELQELMGGTKSELVFKKTPGVVMLVGLQGAGKTTMAAKLALRYKKKNKKPLLVAADIYRPAAIKQLQVLGEQLGVEVFTMGDKNSPVDICKLGLEHAKKNGYDLVIFDTAGRLHIDERLMDELEGIVKVANPDEILLVVDAMTGQDAVNVAKSFNEKLDITGVILTKLDGDTRGGAALSIKAVTGKPIKLVGIGEKIEDLDVFHPDRMASRILGMGDVLTLIEKAEAAIDLEKAKDLQKKLQTQQFTLDDFVEQLQQIKQMGPLDQILGMLPGMGGGKLKGLSVDNKELVKIEAIISSMTKGERANPSIINGSRRKRIAAGSGTKIQDVNRLLKQFEQMQKMMKQFSSLEKSMKKGKKPFPFF
ncbi:signal recognition particle subunit FFH/SRP54 (srp54) [Anaerobranca californiensis DSM 14826]|jgi:signal recognition particle subunit SRP54|uniref:Signal recognition particle protein n=1 Tax=Anaerobranca californiensis DSM 14826 TaxID=1120989 RepID=A0A1M6KMJ7_9FIRM|nr:signal recognition particle protein [Anaerobranca californiensis]SHJ60135.1 signal recognition particle subunit FFH/SRP54 (srp54) [Anaerobranca californiensis DSM 14826]